MTNNEVVQKFLDNAWLNKNQIDFNQYSSGNLTSKNGSLYSYTLKIADIYDRIIWDYSIDKIEELTGYRSMTTRQHIGLIKRSVPDTWEIRKNGLADPVFK